MRWLLVPILLVGAYGVSNAWDERSAALNKPEQLLSDFNRFQQIECETEYRLSLGMTLEEEDFWSDASGVYLESFESNLEECRAGDDNACDKARIAINDLYENHFSYPKEKSSGNLPSYSKATEDLSRKTCQESAQEYYDRVRSIPG